MRGWLFGAVVAVVVFAIVGAMTRPSCNPGYVSAMAFGSGWVCVAGYKP